jgi:hypothetical protein
MPCMLMHTITKYPSAHLRVTIAAPVAAHAAWKHTLCTGAVMHASYDSSLLRCCTLCWLHARMCCLCRFYETDSSIKIGLMEAFQKLAVNPDTLPDIIIASIGRTTWKVRGQQHQHLLGSPLYAPPPLFGS